MREKSMPFLAIVLAFALLTIPAAAPAAQAHYTNAAAHSDALAQAKKVKKTKKPKAKKEEYMRAAPSR
jgi:hypothetical protein